MKNSKGYYHEQIGADIVCDNHEIKSIIVEECDEHAPEIIADMITGNVDRTDPLMVQILQAGAVAVPYVFVVNGEWKWYNPVFISWKSKKRLQIA